MSAVCVPRIDPVLRWAGGKRWLADLIAKATSRIGIDSYVEPFVGGGAVYLSRRWGRATLGDVNEDLISTYRALSTSPAIVAERLRSLAVDAETFEAVRSRKTRSDVGAAVRMIYLNRTSFGGIYRVNRKGEFTTPFAGDRSASRSSDRASFENVGEAFSRAGLVAGDFETTLSQISEPSIVYCDPVYALPGNDQNYRRYSYPPYGWRDQERLASVVHDLAASGNMVLVSGPTDAAIRELYRDARVLHLSRRAMYAQHRKRGLEEGLYVLGPMPMVNEFVREVDALGGVEFAFCGGWM